MCVSLNVKSFAVYIMKHIHTDESTIKSIQEVEFAVVSSITVREEHKAKLCALLSIISPHSKLSGHSISERTKKTDPKSKPNRAKQPPGFEEGKDIYALGDLLLLVRAASVDVIENIQKWREIVHHGIPRPYIYENVNYLLKMCEDLDFLDQIADLVEWLGFRLLRNPFIVDKSLDDIVSSRLLVNVQGSRSLKYWSSASWCLNNKPTTDDKASKVAVSKTRWKVLPLLPSPLVKPVASIGPEDDVVDGSRITAALEILLAEEGFHGRSLALQATQEYVDRGPSRFELESSDNNAEPSTVYEASAMLNSRLKAAEYRSSLLHRESAQIKLTLRDLGNQVCWITLCRESDRTKDHRVRKCRDMYRQEAIKLHSKLIEKLEHCLGVLEGHEVHIECETDKFKGRLSVLKVEKEKLRVARHSNKKAEELARHKEYRKRTPELRSKAQPKKKRLQKCVPPPDAATGNLKTSNNMYEDIEEDIHAIVTRKSTATKTSVSPETVARHLEEKRQRSIYQKRARIEQQARLTKENELGLDRRRAESVAMKAEDALSRLVEREIQRKSLLKARKEKMEREASCAMFKCIHEMNGKRFVISVYIRNARGYDLEGFRFVAYDPRTSSSFTMTMTHREFNSFGYGRTSGGLGAFCKWLCLLYEKRRRQFRLVWSGAPCPPPLRVRENDQALICVQKEGLRMRNVQSGGYSLVAVYLRVDNPSVLSVVVGSWENNEFVLTEHDVEARSLVLGSDLDVHWEASGHTTIVWKHHWVKDDTKSSDIGQRIYSSEIVVNQVKYMLHVHDTDESSYTVNFVAKPKKGVSTPEETESGANTLVLLKEKVNPYNVHLSFSNFADFISLTTFEHITTNGEEHGQPKFQWKAIVSPKWMGKLAKYVRVLRLAKYACKINGLYCFIAIFIVQHKTEFRAHFLLEMTWLAPTLSSSFGGEPTRQSLRIALSNYLRCVNASRRFGLHNDGIEGGEECSSCLAYTMARVKLNENVLAVPNATTDYSLSCSNCALVQYRRLHALQELIIHHTIASELLELIYHGYCDVCRKLVPPILLVLGSSPVLSLLEHYFASFDCSTNGFLHFTEGNSIADEGLHVRDTVLHSISRDQIVVLFNADFGITVSSANAFTYELHWWLYPEHHDLPCHLVYIADHNFVRIDESEAGPRDFDLIEALRALNLAACRISELEPVHLDHGDGDNNHASAFDAYLVAEAVLVEAMRVLLHPEYKWQKPRDIVGASSWSSACSFLLDPVELSGHLQHCNMLQLSVKTGDILDAYFAHAKWPHDYPEVRPCFYGLLDFMLHVQHVRHVLAMKSGSLQGSSVRHIADFEPVGHELLAKNTSVIDCSQLLLEHKTEIFL
ncbi:hypothetical protein P3T76_007260 [Phytophthora citrophthora]|uniref:Uncharacterized protein n=1 Tax=Phytophthora citrophthora TaxID=4793 RepID=A0AAD9LNR9_9STRA|nr:hypothetical protein P3T76_007260 [Phytophthora citrophthora]